MYNITPLQTLPNSFLQTSLLISVDINKSRGSAFVYIRNQLLFLVTAKHVLFKDDEPYGPNIRVSCPRIGSNSRYEVKSNTFFNVDLRNQMPVQSGLLDIAVVHIGNAPSGTNSGSYDITFLSCVEFDDTESIALSVADESCVLSIDKVLLSNDVFLLGYPTSLGLASIPQFNTSLPLLRKGIVANIDNEMRTIILDCPVYPGNSGAPVYQRSGAVTDQFSIIGVVSQFIPYIQEWYNPRDKLKNTEYQNSGYSVLTSMDGVDELIDMNMHVFKPSDVKDAP